MHCISIQRKGINCFQKIQKGQKISLKMLKRIIIILSRPDEIENKTQLDLRR